MSNQDKEVENAKKSAISYAQDWGRSPLPPILLATLTTALHARPLQPLPLTLTPALLLSSYLNLSGYTIDAAGLTSAWSGLYLLLAKRRRRTTMTTRSRWGARGLVRGGAMAVAALNVLGGGLTYAWGKRGDEDATL